MVTAVAPHLTGSGRALAAAAATHNGHVQLPPERLVYPYVLNGIAYNQDTRRLLVTGKCWPHVYEIDLIPRTRR